MTHRVRDSSKTYPKVNPHNIAKALGVDVLEPLRADKGLEVVFTNPLEPLSKLLAGVSLGGVVFFPFECLEGYNIRGGTIFLAEDYGVWKKLGSNIFVFRSFKLNRPEIFINRKRILLIKDLSQGKVLYKKQSDI